VALRRSLAEALATIERVRAGEPEAGVRALPDLVRDDRPGESIPLLEQEVSDLRREIRALEAELARAARA
jgi:cell division septum initiation protein DivIVA